MSAAPSAERDRPPRGGGSFAAVLFGIALAIGLVAAVLAIRSGGEPATATALGIVVAVDARAPGDVRGFDLRTSDGQILTFEIGRLDLAPPAFEAGHLAAHRTSAEPVLVEYTTDGDRRIAIRLTDA